MVRRSKESVRSGAEIRCLLWYQGESDALTEHDAASYQGKMEELVRNVRYIEKVREAQLGMKMEKVVCVDAKGLKLQEDNLHLTTEAAVQLGIMLADAYLVNFAVSS
ncbi:Probable carbohydrate esterase At4g34215 [Linum perenne]